MLAYLCKHIQACAPNCSIFPKKCTTFNQSCGKKILLLIGNRVQFGTYIRPPVSTQLSGARGRREEKERERRRVRETHR